MWPCRSQKGEDARLYEGVKALSDFCCAIHVNVPTGKDSLSLTQQYPNGEKIIAPGTVIVSAGGEVSDVKKVVSPVPVSYTHLDVYKRQALLLGTQRYLTSFAGISYGIVGKIAEHTVEPVSYTHL